MQTTRPPKDLYDDLLSGKLASFLTETPLPESVGALELLEPPARSVLPDRLFAFVEGQPWAPTRKFAMHDAAHTALSVLYFEEADLPEETSMKVASRLLEGCSWYGITPPETSKVAILGAAMNALNVASGVSSMSGAAKAGMQKHKAVVSNMGKLAAQEIPESSGVVLPPGQPRVAEMGGGETVPMSESIRREVRVAPDQERRIQEGGPFDALQKFLNEVFEKRADLTGSDIMPRSGILTKPAGAKSTYGRLTQNKVSHHALPHLKRYPLETELDVKMATRYFDENVEAFTPLERRVFARSVWDRGEELGVKVAGRIADYLGDTYGPHIHGELLARYQSFEGTGHEQAYLALTEKIAETSPAVMAQVLLEIDAATGADRVYGRAGTGFRDPFAAVYGSEKLAEEKPEGANSDEAYTWSDDTDYTTGVQLLSFAKRGPMQLETQFDKKFALAFVKNPVTVFKSMQPTQQKFLVRIMNSNATPASPTH